MNLSLEEKRPAFGCSGHPWSPLDSTRAGCASRFRIDGPGMESAWMHQTSASPARMEFTTSHQVPVSIPEQAISCEGREGNGKLVAASPLRHMRERQPDSEEQVGAKGVTAGETASIYDLVV